MNNSIELTPQEKAELQKISFNDAALGAFCGMINNAMVDLADPKVWTDEDIKSFLKAALRVRVLAREMAK
jgi:hypothetical protein